MGRKTGRLTSRLLDKVYDVELSVRGRDRWGGVRYKVCAHYDCNYMKSLLMKTHNGNRIYQKMKIDIC